MTFLFIPQHNQKIKELNQIKKYLNQRGIIYERWATPVQFGHDADQDSILAAYADSLGPFMEKGGYKTSDVVMVNQDHPKIKDIRQMFLGEHTHTEDEIRFFVEGQGLFWFNLENNQPIFCLMCTEGDLISVPANTKHWFDLGPKAHVKAIRIFIDPAGWVANYTSSKIEQEFNALYESIVQV